MKAVSNRTDHRRSMTGYLFAAPWLLGFLILALCPMILSFLFAFIQWDGISTDTINWQGMGNYVRAAHDPNVHIALWNTAYYSFISTPLVLIMSLALAVLLNQPLRGISMFRTIFYMPSVIGGVATIMMWIWVFDPDYGLLNNLLLHICRMLAALGVQSAQHVDLPKWIYSESWVKPSFILMSLWGGGAAMLIFLAALQNVSESLYEAAELDGAGRWKKFISVTIPQISPAIFFNLIMGVIHSFQVFTQAFVMTEGGPNKASLFYVLYLYNKAFKDFEIGYASALAWILFFIIMAFTLVILRSSKLWVHYEAD